MKNSVFLLFMCIAFFLNAAILPAFAQSQLTELIEQLNKTPDDNVLREQIIKQAQKEKPAIPEEARRFFIQGTTIARSAKDDKNLALAIEAYKEALKIAPWWSDAYYNLAVAQEMAGKFADAKASLNLYILTGPGEKDARAAQDMIYVIEGEEKMVQSSKKSKAAQQKSAASSAPPPLEKDMRYTCRNEYAVWRLFTSEAAKNVILTFTRPPEEVFAGGPITADFTPDRISWGANWQDRLDAQNRMPVFYMHYEFNRANRTLYYSYNNGANGEGTLQCTVN